MPRPVVSKLASVGSECEPKIASLERNKRDVAPRTQRHVSADRHDYGFPGRALGRARHWLSAILRQLLLNQRDISSLKRWPTPLVFCHFSRVATSNLI